MLLLIGYEQWRGISFLGEIFSKVARGRKFYVIVLFYAGSDYVVMCYLALVCGRQYMLLVLYIMIFVSHEGNDAFSEVSDLDTDTPQ